MLLAGCVFETREAFRIIPDLAVGRRWTYQFREFLKQESGDSSDTTRHFISYSVEGDSTIEGVTYRILSEEDLAIFNTDQWIVKNKSLYAIEIDESRIRVKRLKGGSLATGRLPLKSAALIRFDTAHFEDEITVIENPINPGINWVFRSPGHPSGIGPARKTHLGREIILLSGQSMVTEKFRIVHAENDRTNNYEWYAKDKKMLSRISYAANAFNRDSIHIEEEYIGSRPLSSADTTLLIKWSRVER